VESVHLEPIERDIHAYEEPRELKMQPELVDRMMIRLDDGRAVTLLLKGSQRFAPGERVRVLSHTYSPYGPRVLHESARLPASCAFHPKPPDRDHRDSKGAYATHRNQGVVMKRIIAAVSFVALAVPTFVFAAEAPPPYEKTQFDRILADVHKRDVSETASAGSTSARGNLANGAWVNDHNFISPGR
jgi:hypothetical protein